MNFTWYLKRYARVGPSIIIIDSGEALDFSDSVNSQYVYALLEEWMM